METRVNNISRMELRIDAALALLRKNYALEERPAREFAVMEIAGLSFQTRQFDIADVGNLFIMKCTADGPIQVSTITITPYFKDVPLLSSDYMHQGEGRSCINEAYDLLGSGSELFVRYVERFTANRSTVDGLEDMQIPPSWYDDLRPVLMAKRATPADDDLIEGVHLRNLETFIEMEQESPALAGSDLENRKLRNSEYAQKLVEAGGVSTSTFTKVLGAETAMRFFSEVFFAPDLY